MPYSDLKELPPQATQNLPLHAQEIYQKAFNNAWEEYADPAKRRGHESREEVSHKVAWSAVEKKYKKDENGNWVKK
jgi:cation transport regulator